MNLDLVSDRQKSIHKNDGYALQRARCLSREKLTSKAIEAGCGALSQENCDFFVYFKFWGEDPDNADKSKFPE